MIWGISFWIVLKRFCGFIVGNDIILETSQGQFDKDVNNQ